MNGEGSSEITEAEEFITNNINRNIQVFIAENQEEQDEMTTIYGEEFDKAFEKTLEELTKDWYMIPKSWIPEIILR